MTEAESWAMPALPITITGVPAIAERLRITRQALRLKQAALCRQTGIAPNTYNQWEQERGRPDLDGAMKLCDAFGITLDWIYRGSYAGLPYEIAEGIRNIERGRPGAGQDHSTEADPPFARQKSSRSR